MSAKRFKEFKLLFHLIYFDSSFDNDFSIPDGKVFDLDDKLMLSAGD